MNGTVARRAPVLPALSIGHWALGRHLCSGRWRLRDVAPGRSAAPAVGLASALLLLLLWQTQAWAQATPPPAPTTGEIVEYYATDALGSVRVVFTASGAEVGRADYLPFGERFNTTGPLPPQQFTGQQRDPEVQLDHFNARSYQPTTGRFTGIDPLYAGMFDPQQWNRYGYARANPLKFVDPTGQQIVPCPPSKPEGTICMTIIGLLPGGGGSTQPEYPDRILPPAWYRKPMFTGEPRPPTGPGDAEPPTIPTPPPGPEPPIPAPPAPPPPNNEANRRTTNAFLSMWGYCMRHAFRNASNVWPSAEPKGSPSFELDLVGKYRFHNGSECRYRGGRLLPDNGSNYTFNFGPDPYTPTHVFLDVLPTFLCGPAAGGLTTTR